MKKIKLAFLFKAKQGLLGAGSYNHLRHWISKLKDEFEIYFLNCWENKKEFLLYFGVDKIRFIYIPELASKNIILAAKNVGNTLKKCKIHILHTMGLHSDIIGSLATFYYRPILFISSVEGYLTGYQCPWYKQIIYKNLYKIVKRRVDIFTAISNQTAEELKNDFGVPSKKIRVLHSGVDPEMFKPKEAWPFKPSLDPMRPRIGMIGRLSKEKGGELFLYAARLIALKYPLAQFFIAGDGPQREELHELSRALGISGQTFFLKWVTNPITFYEKIDILLIPAPRICDGLPWAVLEGLATCTPIVATKGGGIPEAIIHKKTGILVEPDNPEALANATIWLWEHPKEALTMVRCGRKAIEDHFNTTRELNELKQIYMKGITDKTSTENCLCK
jgi:glycosyltransferase involved in cell wall biosynthesis